MTTSYRLPALPNHTASFTDKEKTPTTETRHYPPNACAQCHSNVTVGRCGESFLAIPVICCLFPKLLCFLRKSHESGLNLCRGSCLKISIQILPIYIILHALQYRIMLTLIASESQCSCNVFKHFIFYFSKCCYICFFIPQSLTSKTSLMNRNIFLTER